MKIEQARVIVEGQGGGAADREGAVGELDVRVTTDPDGRVIGWSLTNPGAAPRSITRAAIVYRLEHSGPLRIFREGLQSWSPSDVAVLGVDRDPSFESDHPDELRATFHADWRRVTDSSELRSEWVTLLADERELLRVGFDGGTRHDGTFRVRKRGEHTELWVEAFLGDAVLAPGQRLELHGVSWERGSDPSELLASWARETGARGKARSAAPHTVGWCSWYRYFAEIGERELRENLARAGDWPFAVFQLDDGYERTIGDWLHPNERFPSGLAALARSISDKEMIPGIWIAPFLVAPDSSIFRDHPDWIAKRRDGVSPHVGMYNPAWDGGMGGLMFTLDTTKAEVQEHLEKTARELVRLGFRYLKLDFTFAPRLDGIFADPSATPAQRVRLGFEAIRRGAGEDTFILGCGAPLAAALGLVDAMRIGADVSPTWDVHVPTKDGVPYGAPQLPGYERVQPSTRNALIATMMRAYMHRRLWANDPDCIMLRRNETQLTAEQLRTWAHAAAVSGGLCLLSDDLMSLGAAERAFLDELIAISRAADQGAERGDVPRCPDLLAHGGARRLRSAAHELVLGDLEGASRLLER